MPTNFGTPVRDPACTSMCSVPLDRDGLAGAGVRCLRASAASSCAQMPGHGLQTSAPYGTA